MAGAVFEVVASLFVAGAVFGGVGVSFFLAGAAFGEILNGSRGAKCGIFAIENARGELESNLGCEAGDGFMVGIVSEWSRIMLGSSPHCQ